MAYENVELFMMKALDDKELLDRLVDINQAYVEGMSSDFTDEKRTALIEEYIIPIAEEYGIPFTADELNRFYDSQNMEGNEDYEIRESDLELVAGGVGRPEINDVLNIITMRPRFPLF